MSILRPNQRLFSASILAFLVYVLSGLPIHPLEKNWVELIIVVAVLILVPQVLSKAKIVHPAQGPWVILAGLAYALAYRLDPGIVAGLLILPWLALALWSLGKTWLNQLNAPWTWSKTLEMAAFAFFPVAPLAALSERIQVFPLGFSPMIILLTAAHFHYAGLLLTWITAQLQGTFPHVRYLPLVSCAVLLGIPAVAFGIVASQLNAAPWLEAAAASTMVAGGLGVAGIHGYLAWKPGLRWFQRGGLLGLALCLGGGMLLAFTYAWRSYCPWMSFNIPWMYALHGTLNTLGVGIFGVAVWCGRTNFQEFIDDHRRSTP